MTEPGLECLNCGRENPAWAQICRNCGVSLSDAAPYPSGPPPRFPTDRSSLVALGSALATIVLAIFVGLFLVNLDPSSGTALQPPPSSPPITASIVPSVLPSVAPTPPPTPTATPGFPATLVFGTAVNEAQEIVEPDPDYTRGEIFAYSIRMAEPFGVPEILVEVIEMFPDGTEVVVQAPSVQTVDPNSPVVAFQVSADQLIDAFGPGSYRMQVYRGEEQIAEGEFTLGQ